MTLRILHVSEPTEGGVAVVAAAMATDQRDRGWDVAVAAPEHGELLTRAAAAGVTVLPWRAARRPGRGLPREVRELRRIVARVDPDLVHLHSSKAGLAGRLAVRGRRPTIFQPHGWSFSGSSGVGLALREVWERVGARWSVVVCVSDAEHQRGRDARIRARFVVIPNGVDTNRFAYAPGPARVAARAQLGLPAVPTVVSVARLSAEKGQQVLLDAWPQVRAAVPSAALVLVGDGPARADLERRAAPGVRFAGTVDNVVPWYAAADVVALASWWEAMPLSVLEAMAVGRSGVVTAVDGAEEALGDAGVVVPVGDAAALAAAISARLQDPTLATAEGRRARARVERCYSLATWGERLAALVTDLAGTSRRQS